VVSIWFLGGLITFSIGILGVYLSKVFTEVKKRPYVIVKEVYQKEEED
jgi:putative glycosyltransferase